MVRIVDTGSLPMLEKLPGWHGKLIHADSMTFAHWDFDEGATIHEHFHEQEEVWHIIEGELEAMVDGERAVAGPGMVLILPPNAHHSIRALSAGKAIVADHPVRGEFQ
jgi:quercetin dioxygenase-like cupin family protein